MQSPHWSQRGQTVLFKTRVTCVGNMASIRVRISTLMGRRTATGMVLVAGGREDRIVRVDGHPSQPFYCPKVDARKIRRDGWYRGQATLAIVEAGGTKTPPAYEQTKLILVKVP